MKKEQIKLIYILLIGLITSLALTTLFPTITSIRFPGPHSRGLMFIQNFWMIKIFLSSLNIILITILLLNYLSIYKEIPNKFTMSLIIFSIALMLYAVSSNPITHLLLGFRGGLGLGPFTFLPDAFATIAIIILLHQTLK